MQAPTKTLNMVLAINKHLKVYRSIHVGVYRSSPVEGGWEYIGAPPWGSIGASPEGMFLIGGVKL